MRERIDWAGVEVDESFQGVETSMDLGGSVEIDDLDEQQRNEQWRQGEQEDPLAEALDRVEEDKEQRRTATKTESGEVEH